MCTYPKFNHRQLIDNSIESNKKTPPTLQPIMLSTYHVASMIEPHFFIIICNKSFLSNNYFLTITVLYFKSVLDIYIFGTISFIHLLVENRVDMTLLVANNNNDNFVVSVVYISTIRVKRQ
jgi:hypothetical protein